MKSFIQILLSECPGQKMFTLEDVQHANDTFFKQLLTPEIIDKNYNKDMFYINNPNIKQHGQIVRSDCNGNMAGLTKITYQNGKSDYIHIKFLIPLK